MTKDKIVVKGARQHNLKNINLEIPRDRLVVITGISGSGKSSLAFDTLYAEGQRRYIESLSAYARQFLEQMDKPDVDYIEGLSPAISIEQRPASRNPRSTVATVTEIYDYLRLLWSSIGRPHCHICGREITKQTVEQIVDQVLRLPENSRIQILGPAVRGKKGEHKDVFSALRKKGFVRIRVDGEALEISTEFGLDKKKKHTIEVVVDRLQVKPDIAKRLADSLQTALEIGSGIVVVEVDGKEEQIFSQNLACPDCGTSLEELSPRMFSFNSPYGACKECSGLGTKLVLDPDLVMPNKAKSLREGAIVAWSNDQDSWSFQALEAVADHYGFSLDTRVSGLNPKHLDILLRGSKQDYIRFGYSSYPRPFEGVLNTMERRYWQTSSEYMRDWYRSFMRSLPCTACNGQRLRPESLAVKVGRKSIADACRLTIQQAYDFFTSLPLTEKEMTISKQILKEIRERLGFLLNVGLDYLTLDRTAGTLSAGEAQRTQLATQIGSGLMGVVYILDEPSIGLHQRDNRRLIDTLKKLRDLGNCVIVVEHDRETIEQADFVVDLGPGAGVHGGYVVVAGPPEVVKRAEDSITGQYLGGKREIMVPSTRRHGNGKHLTVRGARENNLKHIDVRFPLGAFTCITGVSGSGKSTLLEEILYRALAQKLHGAKDKPGAHDTIEGVESIDKVVMIDQSPIGRTPRSNPATYTKVFTHIRELFSKLAEARARGYRPGRFSFNVKGGRCEACEGDGVTRIEMHFLPDVYVRCDVCKGDRYNRETLEIKYKDKSIADVLAMTVEEALIFFENIPPIKNKLQTINDVGLGYIALGQPATTLSGGEAQRVKLATELSRRATGRTVYVLDEPTTGLHFDDIQKLLDVLNRLVDAGNTVIVIEHNLDVIKTADYIIDLGPEGGDDGGEIVVEGVPELVARTDESYTGMFLREMLAQKIPS